jgi:hypothetical protein
VAIVRTGADTLDRDQRSQRVTTRPGCCGSRIAQLAVHRLENPASAREGEQEKYYAPVRPQASGLSVETQEFVDLHKLGDRLRSRLG